MRLYMHPISMTSRPVRLFIAENKIACEEEVVDLMKGAHYQEPYASLNPNRLVPMLVDGDLKLTESSTILKYLADYFGAGIVTLGELLGCDFASYPNIRRWLANVKKLSSWGTVNQEFYGLREAIKAQNFVRV